MMTAIRSLRAAMLLSVFLSSVSLADSAFAQVESYFDMEEQRSDNIRPFPKWTGMIQRYDEQQDSTKKDDACGRDLTHPCSLSAWMEMVESVKGLGTLEQLEKINDWGNKHPYIEDQINWGLEDFWETPPEFMEISGDCEDYAISKYYTLRAAGVPASRMRIIILQDLNLGGVIHAVLGVYDGEDLYILDNQSQQVTHALKIYHYRPIFGINEEAWWAYYPKNN